MAIDDQVITQSPHVATLGDELTTSRLVNFPSYKLSFEVVVKDISPVASVGQQVVVVQSTNLVFSEAMVEDISPVAGTGQQVVVVQTWCSVRQW